MSTECFQVRSSLGVYVLGAIEPAERAMVDAHLGTCRRCRDELVLLAGLPALLGHVTEEQITQASAPPKELLDALLTQATRQNRARRRRNRVWLGVAAAAAVVMAGAGVFGGTRIGDVRPAPYVTTTIAPPVAAAARIVSGKDPATGVRAQITMEQREWGTAFTVRLTGAPGGAKCRLIAIGADGRRDVAGGWQVESTGYDDFRGSSMIPRDRITSLEVRTIGGQRLLTIRT